MQRESNSFQGNTAESLSRSQREPLRCENCDIEILWPATIVQGKAYCCTGCAAGGPCSCDYSLYHSTTISGVIYYRE